MSPLTDFNTLAQINAEIQRLEAAFIAAKGTLTEVWSRIVGYYGNIQPGRRLIGREEEINERLPYDAPIDARETIKQRKVA